VCLLCILFSIFRHFSVVFSFRVIYDHSANIIVVSFVTLYQIIRVQFLAVASQNFSLSENILVEKNFLPRIQCGAENLAFCGGDIDILSPHKFVSGISRKMQFPASSATMSPLLM